jgi:mobilization protein NikA
MVDHIQRPAPAACRGAARRHRVEGGRRHQVKVRFTEAELEAIIARAADAHVSVQRFMVGSALARRPQAAVPVQLAAEVASLRRLVANLANNINQIARRLNSGGAPDAGLTAAADSVRRAMNRLDVAIAWLDSPQAATGPAVQRGSGGHQDPPRTAGPPLSRNDPPSGPPSGTLP